MKNPIDISTPESPENLAASFAFVQSHYQGLDLVSKLLESYHDMLGAVLPMQNSSRDRIFRELFSRVTAWCQSLRVLNSSQHYQAIAAGNRSLLEILVDVVLLFVSDGESVAKIMLAHRESQQLKVNESIVKFYLETNLSDRPIYLDSQRFLENEKSRIELLRQEYWMNKSGKGMHPDRWTGNSLREDVAKCDKVLNQKILVGNKDSLEEFYSTEYGRLNWHIHSGTASTWHMPTENYDLVVAFALWSATDLALLSARLILKEFKFTDANDGFRKQWEMIDIKRSEYRTNGFRDMLEEFDSLGPDFSVSK